MKEKKVYVVDCSEDFDFRYFERIGELDKIKDKAKKLGTVYSLQDFQDGCNDEEINLVNSFILIS